MPEAVEINPELLSWARETAGLSLEEAAEKLGLKNSKLRELEAGERPVSEAQLQRASALYRRPLVSFYLPRPPARGERGEDFRTAPGALSARDNALLDALMRDARARQQMVRELLIEEDAGPLPFVASAKIEHGVPAVAAAIRNALGVTEEHQKAAKGAAEIFTLLRAAVERRGIYVLLLGGLGSRESDIGDDVFSGFALADDIAPFIDIGDDVFRGFALADDIAPFIVINYNDAVTARAFTLMHELVHIWIGASGVSGPLSALSENAIERFCNAVAGEFLLPVESDALPDLRQADAETVLRAAAHLADAWNVSEGVVTYRFFNRSRISEDVAASLFRMFGEQWRAEKSKRKEKENAGKPSYYAVRRHRLGNGLLSVVRRAIHEETITHTRAAKILGVSATSIDQLLQERIRAA